VLFPKLLWNFLTIVAVRQLSNVDPLISESSNRIGEKFKTKLKEASFHQLRPRSRMSIFCLARSSGVIGI
jgi:hypothetical protein